jgi:hypothetical protein
MGFAIYTAGHWLTAIGLSSHIYSVHRSKSGSEAHWYDAPFVFAIVLIVASVLCFVLLFASSTFTPSNNLIHASIHITATAIGLRAGLGFVHFLYDRYIYKFSNEEVRATIGKDLFQ